VVLALLLVLGGWLLARRPELTGVPPSFPLTLHKLANALVRALPLPAACYAVGWLLGRPPVQVQPGIAVGAGLRRTALVLFVLLAVWQILRRRGVGADLHWSLRGAKHVRRHLLWFVPAKAFTAFLVVTFDRQPVNAWNDSLGRLAFCLGLIALTAFGQRVLRPEGPLLQSHLERAPVGWIARLRGIWYPVVLALPVVLGGLALGGYYYTATRLEACFEASLVLVGCLLVLHGLLLRWLLLARRRLAQQQAAAPGPAPAEPVPTEPLGAGEPAATEPPEAGEPAATEPPEAGEPAATAPEAAAAAEPTAAAEPGAVSPAVQPPDDPELPDLVAVREQSGKLFRSLVAISLLVGLATIWHEVLPALGRLEQVQIWPTVAIVDMPQEDAYVVLERAAPPTPTPAPDAGVETPSGPVPGVGMGPALPGSPVDTPQTEALPVRVTLADLGLALLVLAVTLVLSKNLPGFLEIVLLERLPLDAGARYAVITVTRYVLVFVGVTVGCGQLGIGWSSIQWLAAALTFGLAFGLQEVFANFVSGLILLAERPIRVGDVVTVGAVNGKVTKIRIRATTIGQWNGRELIIPNKNFVTGEVVNWTLTETRIRIEIPVGVAYGSDTALTKRLMVDVARAHPTILQEPPANAFFIGFGASSLDFELRAWVPSPDHLPQVREDLLEGIQAALRGVGIEIAFPQHDLHLKSGGFALQLDGERGQLRVAPERAPLPAHAEPED
jgi:potassium efflux system protein